IDVWKRGRTVVEIRTLILGQIHEAGHDLLMTERPPLTHGANPVISKRQTEQNHERSTSPPNDAFRLHGLRLKRIKPQRPRKVTHHPGERCLFPIALGLGFSKLHSFSWEKVIRRLIVMNPG